MLLSMDDDGNIYEAASHRPDGQGYERRAAPTSGGDVALGSPYKRAEEERQQNWKNLNSLNAQENLMAERAAHREKIRQAHLQSKLAQENQILLDPRVQNELKTHAASQYLQGADFDQLEVSGYGKSADGIPGPSRHQVAAEAAVLQSMGAEPELADDAFVHSVSDEEVEQYKLQSEYRASKEMENNAQAVQVEAVETDSVVDESLPPTYADTGKPTPPGIDKKLAQLETEARIAEAGSGGQALTKAVEWAKANPLMAAGIGVVAYKLLLKR